MKKNDFLQLSDARFLAIAFVILSFLPLEPSCVPGNFFLVLSPFFFAAIRYLSARKLTRDDVLVTAGFLALIIFVTLLAAATNCTQDYFFLEPLQDSWQGIAVDSLSPDGVIQIKNVRSVQVALADIIVRVGGVQQQCTWPPGSRYIPPGETLGCALPVSCGDRSIKIDVLSPGNSDSIMC